MSATEIGWLVTMVGWIATYHSGLSLAKRKEKTDDLKEIEYKILTIIEKFTIYITSGFDQNNYIDIIASVDILSGKIYSLSKKYNCNHSILEFGDFYRYITGDECKKCDAIESVRVATSKALRVSRKIIEEFH